MNLEAAAIAALCNDTAGKSSGSELPPCHDGSLQQPSVLLLCSLESSKWTSSSYISGKGLRYCLSLCKKSGQIPEELRRSGNGSECLKSNRNWNKNGSKVNNTSLPFSSCLGTPVSFRVKFTWQGKGTYVTKHCSSTSISWVFFQNGKTGLFSDIIQLCREANRCIH